MYQENYTPEYQQEEKQPLNKTTITIDEVVDKGSQLKVKGTGQDGQHTYTLWKAKKDGKETQAYQQFKFYGVGKQITFGWEIYNGEYQGKPYQSRSVKLVDTKTANTQPVQKPKQLTYNQPSKIQSLPGSTFDYDKQAFGKCKHAFLVELLKKDIVLSIAEVMAEDWANASMRKIEKKENNDYQIPEESFDEHLNTEERCMEIPF